RFPPESAGLCSVVAGHSRYPGTSTGQGRRRRWNSWPWLVPGIRAGWIQEGLPIATEKKTTNLARGPDFAAFSLLEIRLRGADSRKRIRERLSRTKNPGDREASPESLGTSRLPSFARASLNTCHPEDRWFFLRNYRKPLVRR